MSKMKGFSLRMPKNYDRLMHFCILLLLLLGSLMVLSTNAKDIDAVYKSIIRQIPFLIVSYLLMITTARYFVRMLSREVKIRDDRVANKKAKNFYRGLFRIIGVAIGVLLVLTLVIGDEINGSKSWIQLGFFSLQPSEFAKVYMILLLGIIVNDYGHRRIKFMQFMSEPLFFFVFTILIIMMQPDFGTFIVFTGITMACMLIPSNKNLDSVKKLILFCTVLIVGAMFFLSTDFGMSILEKFNLGYKFNRFESAADPFKDMYNTGYNIFYSLSAIANGGVSGLGFGNSELKYGYLPEASTDFIFSITIEELGILGLILIVGCYLIIIYKLLFYALKTKSEGYKVILIGSAVYLSLHFILNIGGVSALIPLTGVPLLFISSGGSSMLSIMCLMGVCQSIIALTRSQMARIQDSKNST